MQETVKRVAVVRLRREAAAAGHLPAGEAGTAAEQGQEQRMAAELEAAMQVSLHRSLALACVPVQGPGGRGIGAACAPLLWPSTHVHVHCPAPCPLPLRR